MTDWENNEEINIFREYLRIPTVHPNINYDTCSKFIKEQAINLDLSFEEYYPVKPNIPIIVVKWIGTQPDLPSILLSSHVDVVPVYEESWTHPPFAAEIDSEGRIYARGAQDMKCVGMQYFAAIRAMKREGIYLKRTIVLLFGPDEETGGKYGTKPFVETEEFRSLNIGFAMDEGMAMPGEVYAVFFDERRAWYTHIKCNGATGHGSLLHKNTAGEKVRYILDKFMDFRKNEVQKLESNPELTLGDVTTVNLNIIEGGVQNNVLPPFFKIVFDIRVAITASFEDLEDLFRKWCKEAGDDVELSFSFQEPLYEVASLENSIFWKAFKNACKELHIQIKPQVFPAGTDIRFIRRKGIPAIGFSPMNFTPVLLHANDEFIKAETYLNGIIIMKKIIHDLGNA